MILRFIGWSLCLVAFACSSDSQVAAPASPAPTADAAVDVAPAPDKCEPIAKASKCEGAPEGAIVRALVHFDPAKVPAGAKAGIALFLHHQFVLSKSEIAQGGHPHAYKWVPLTDPSTGSLSVEIDMCLLGTAMWSEENGDFNLVAILDTTGAHNAAKEGETALKLLAGEPMKVAPVTVSCHAKSKCLDLALDCDKGSECATYTAPTKVECAANACPSDDSICKM